MPPDKDQSRPGGGGPSTQHSDDEIGYPESTPDLPTVDTYVVRLHCSLTKTAESIIETGNILIEAKVDLAHGEFGPMLAEVGISDQMARKFMRVANAFSDRYPGNGLPASVTILDELTRVPDEALGAAIEDGRVSTSMTRREAEELRRESKVMTQSEAEEITERIRTVLSTLADEVYAALVGMEDADDGVARIEAILGASEAEARLKFNLPIVNVIGKVIGEVIERLVADLGEAGPLALAEVIQEVR